MNRRESFDDALDAAIDQVRGGRPLADVLAAHPQHAHDLRPLLETSQFVRASAQTAAHRAPGGLADNFTIVQAALERERMAQAQSMQAGVRERAPWWQRRWTVASLSMPAAFVVAALLAGAGGATAATVAVAGTDIGARAASAVIPEWAAHAVPSALHLGNDDAGTPSANGRQDAPGINGDSGQGAHPAITVTGVIGDPQGNTFTLAAGDGEWKIQFDGKTEISGGIVAGANATVIGAETGAQALHGTQISTDAAAESSEEGSPGDNNGSEPGTGDNDDGAGPADNNANPPEDPGAGSNGSAPGENSADRTPPLGRPTPTSTRDATEEEEQGISDTGPPGQGASLPGNGGQLSENSGTNDAGSNGGGPKKP